MTNLHNKGSISIIGVIFLAIVVILALNYFHLSLNLSVHSTDTQSSTKGDQTLSDFWNTYFAKPVNYLWNEIILKYFWQPFLEGMKSGPNTTTGVQLIPSANAPNSQ